ncbi:hypothetical protein HDU87_001042 [Geranomyces variabilis]|uniref:Uncharacterized protein n=1 Tax=Geranomyces variabilis TaxID=109894 RepID=A0AAD5TSS9_9FUNG|nr:hypothetical protein HDU87_001042 [Geranomyces variabilis]
MANQNRKRAEAAATRRRQAAKAAAERAATISKKALKKLNAAAKIALPEPTADEDRYFGIGSGKPARIITSTSFISKPDGAAGGISNTLLTPPKSTPASPTKVVVAPTSPTKLVVRTLSFASVIKGASVPVSDAAQALAGRDDEQAHVVSPVAVNEADFPCLSPTKRTKMPEWPIKAAASSAWAPAPAAAHKPAHATKAAADVVAPAETKAEVPATSAASLPTVVRRPRFVTSLKEAGPLSAEDIARAVQPKTAAPSAAPARATALATSAKFAEIVNDEPTNNMKSTLSGSNVSPSSSKDTTADAKPNKAIEIETSPTKPDSPVDQSAAPSSHEGVASALPVSFASAVNNDITSALESDSPVDPSAASSSAEGVASALPVSFASAVNNDITTTLEQTAVAPEGASKSTEPEEAPTDKTAQDVTKADASELVPEANFTQIETATVTESGATSSANTSGPASPTRKVKPSVSFADVAKGYVPDASDDAAADVPRSVTDKTVGVRTDSGTCVDDEYQEAATSVPSAVEQPNRLLKTIYTTAKAHPVLSYGAGACVAATWLPVVLLTSPITVPCALSSAFTYRYLMPERLKQPVRAVASAVRRQHDLCAAAL